MKSTPGVYILKNLLICLLTLSTSSVFAESYRIGVETDSCKSSELNQSNTYINTNAYTNTTMAMNFSEQDSLGYQECMSAHIQNGGSLEWAKKNCPKSIYADKTI